jgi:zinc protease
MGYERDIAAMPKMLDYSKKFFARYYRPENTIIVITGDVDADATMAMVERYWAGWKRGYVAPKVPKEPLQTAERKVEVRYEGRTLPIVALAYKAGGFAPRDLDWVSQRVLAEVYFGSTSELYKALVLDQQLVQSVSASPSDDRDPSLFVIFGVVKDEAKLGDVQAMIEATIARATNELADPKRVADVVANQRNGFLLRMETPKDVAAELAQLAAVTGGISAIDELDVTLGKVTPESIRAAAQRLFDNRRRTVATLREKK